MQEETIDIPTTERAAKKGVRPMQITIYRADKRVHFDAEARPKNDADEPIGPFARNGSDDDCDTTIDMTDPEDQAGMAWLQKLWQRALAEKAAQQAAAE